MNNKEKVYRKLYTIRAFEQTLESYFSNGRIRGTTHGCIGQEAIAVASMNNINIEEDWVTSNHRCHGHFLALTDDSLSLAAEIMGKEIGVLNGKGASQHIRTKHFLTNGITGGMIPIACGIAMSKGLKREPGIVVAFLGDGAMNEGYVLESINMASIYQLPILFVLENNMYAMSTKSSKVTAGNFQKRIESYDIHYSHVLVNDYFSLEKTFVNAYQFAKTQITPSFIECETYRFCGHSKSDKKEYMAEKEVEEWRLQDPLLAIRNEMDEKIASQIEKEVQNNIRNAFSKAASAQPPNPMKVLHHVTD